MTNIVYIFLFSFASVLLVHLANKFVFKIKDSSNLIGYGLISAVVIINVGIECFK